MATVTIDLLGGLGNQLFQYALGRSLEHDLNIPGRAVQWNIERLEGDTVRCYLLDRLGLNLPLVRGGFGRRIDEGSLRYKPEMLMLSGDAHYVGYWQCENYFMRVRDLILKEVFRNMSITDDTQRFASRIMDCGLGRSACFLHVRRSDNTHPRNNAFHGCPGRGDYYDKAIAYIRERVEGVRFFVFSEDPAWCHANMNDSDMTVVDINPMSGTCDAGGTIRKGTIGREVEDLWLMSLCKHAIVCNSTFSWWGAWLNPFLDAREVVAPKKWFNVGPDKADPTDIIPKRWVRL